MKKQIKAIVNLIAICVLTIYSNRIVAQQSRVDSAIHLFNKSIINNKIDTVSWEAAFELLPTDSLTDNQINQLEAVTFKLDSLKYYLESSFIHNWVFSRLMNTNAGKAITYGKLQIEKWDELSRPEISGIRTAFLNLLRIPFRNTTRLEEGFRYYTQKLNDYKIRNDSSGLSQCYFVLAGFYYTSGLIDLAIYNIKKSISYFDTIKQKGTWINHTYNIAFYYSKKGDINESLKYFRLVLKEKTKTRLQNFTSTIGMANVFIQANQLDSAAHYINLAKKDTTPHFDAFQAAFLQIDALYNINAENLEEAENLLKKCWQLIHKSNIPANAQSGIISPDYYLAMVRIKQNRFDEAIALLTKDIERLLNIRIEKLRDYRLLADLYKKTGKNDKAAETYTIFIGMQDSLLADQDKYRSFSFEAEQLISEKELSITKLESKNKISSLIKNFSIGVAVLLLLIAAGIYNRFRTKKKANVVLEKTLTDLKSAQVQLIQSEKMASLGELTAGIAHEIQNPLNFVNNFSEVSTELVDEMNSEIEKGNTEDAKLIAQDLKQNLEKINHHGKRAGDIVKSMLEHSRSSSGKKEPTDINKLADEYLRLAYHGLRAKDKSFNATMKTDFDESIGNINIIPQDIGRVVLNLINNAFYVVDEKKSSYSAAADSADNNYEPTVSVSTKKVGDKILIGVKDNGNGIPQKVLDKIFQPFFTTKPTGQGTGLGLSLSYDIVKAHGGELKVETKEGEGSEFIISLPVN
jgi:signal transduction histidine kinase